MRLASVWFVLTASFLLGQEYKPGLQLHVYKPADWKANQKRTAIVFFFGGGWTSGTPTQFEPQSRHLASRGMIAIVADYRVKTRQDAKPADCVSDAKACVRWTPRP